MGSRIWLPATVAALSVTFSGCDSSADPQDQSAPSASDTTTSAEDLAAAAVAGPDVGICWSVPPDAAFDQDYWFDDSPTVPCTEPHTTETVWVLTLTEPTIAEAKEQADICWDQVRRFVGVDQDYWVPWAAVAFLPSPAEVADGASWARCDAAFPASWDFSSARTTTGSAARVAFESPEDLWACLDEDPKEQTQPFVPCDEPHQYEQTGTLAILEGLERYPSRAELDAAAREQCSLDIPGELSDSVAVTARWDPRMQLRDSTSLAGSCFFFNKSGEPLAPRP